VRIYFLLQQKHLNILKKKYYKKSLNNNSFATIDMQQNLVSISMKIENDYKKKIMCLQQRKNG
jgi:uncharacterized membrane protein